MNRLSRVFLPFLLTCLPAFATDLPVYELAIRDHRFDPATLTIPAGQKVKLHVKNLDSTPEEFESNSLNREKVIPGNGEGIVFVGPLSRGKYEFFGDFNQATAQGSLVVE
jgi:hypothetical protein